MRDLVTLQLIYIDLFILQFIIASFRNNIMTQKLSHVTKIS